MTTQTLVRLIGEDELDLAYAIVGEAFCEHMGLPDPSNFGNGATCTARWHMDPESVFGIEEEGQLGGVAFAAAWGSFGFFGPLCVLPDFWNRKLGQKLLVPVMEYFEKRGVRHAELFTFANSVKHIRLYQKFGFYPRALTAVTRKKIALVSGPAPALPEKLNFEVQNFSEIPPSERQVAFDEIRNLTDEIMPGLDLTCEIRVVAERGIGDTLLLRRSDSGILDGFAICHFGVGSEAEQNTLFVKFGAVRPGLKNAGSAGVFDGLLQACESLARCRNFSAVSAGVNTARVEAYEIMQRRDYIPVFMGVQMHRPNAAGFSHESSFVIDDLR